MPPCHFGDIVDPSTLNVLARRAVDCVLKTVTVTLLPTGRIAFKLVDAFPLTLKVQSAPAFAV